MAAAKTPAQQAPPSLQNTSGRIKYADPRSLPSFPSSGLAPDGAAASAAASLGWSNQKSVDLWKPDPSSSASAAAVLAKDYKMSPQWEPSAQSDGHKAARLAVGSAGAALKKSNTVTARSGPSQETWGNSAATQAFHANRPLTQESLSVVHGSTAATQAFNVNRSQSMKKVERPKTPPGNKSLVAAKGAMNRPASVTGLKDVQASEASAAASALNGATLAHRQSMKAKPGLEDVGAVSVTTMTRNMFTANPPVKPEVDERTYNEKIHQSAVEMAKKMYARQQIMVEQTKGAHAKEAGTSQPNQYSNLQDAAYKQAQARLAKMHDEHHQSREFQEYYGNEKQSPKNRNSMINKFRRRGSDSDDSMNDRRQSEKIREQMSMFSSKLSQVDKEKREKDREALLAAAQRNVKARLHGMDEKLYQETGRANPNLITDWEAKVQKAAQIRHEPRTDNKGKIDIGGGMFMTQEEIDAIASKRIQPVLDDINDKAETERERQEVLRLEEQARREEAEKEKSRDREVKEIVKKTKEQEKQGEKAKKLQEKLDIKHRKDEEKAKKEEDKAAKAEQKRQAKEEKRKSKLGPTHVTASSATQQDENGDAGSTRGRDSQNEGIREPGSVQPMVETNIEASGSSQLKGEGSSSPTSKVKGWIKNRFSRGKSFGEQDKKRRSFFGGASMKDKDAAVNGSAVSIENRSTSMHDVALAGKTGGGEESGEQSGSGSKPKIGNEAAQDDADRDSQGVSPVSTPLEEERELGDNTRAGEEGSRRSGRTSIEPPRRMNDPVARTSSSPTRDSRFREEMDR